jgi:hypothetical protein
MHTQPNLNFVFAKHQVLSVTVARVRGYEFVISVIEILVRREYKRIKSIFRELLLASIPRGTNATAGYP